MAIKASVKYLTSFPLGSGTACKSDPKEISSATCHLNHCDEVPISPQDAEKSNVVRAVSPVPVSVSATSSYCNERLVSSYSPSDDDSSESQPTYHIQEISWLSDNSDDATAFIDYNIPVSALGTRPDTPPDLRYNLAYMSDSSTGMS